MDTLTVSLDLKNFQALLLGLVQKNYSGSTTSSSSGTVTIDSLINKLYPNSDLSADEIRNEVILYDSIIKKAATDTWSTDYLKEFLRSRDFPEDHTAVFVNLWNRESDKIHQRLMQQVTYNHTLAQVSWRVDMKTISKNSSDINEPVSFFEMNFAQPQDAKKKKVAKFEMSRDEVQDMLKSLQDIQSAFDGIANKST